MAASAAASAGADMDPVLMQKLALFECQGLPKKGIRKEERASRFYQSLSKYRRLDAAADFVHVAWALNAPLFAQAQALPNKADVVFAVDAAGAQAMRKEMGIKSQNSSLILLELQIREGVDSFEVGEITGTLKNLVSVAKHKLPSLLGSLNMKVSMKKGAAPPVLQIALWIDNPTELEHLFTIAAMLRSLRLDLVWDNQPIQNVGAKLDAEIARHFITLISSNHVLPPTLSVIVSRLRQELSLSLSMDTILQESSSEALWQTLRAFVHSYVRDVMVLEEANPVIKRLYFGFVKCFSRLNNVSIFARDYVLRANLAHIPVLAVLASEHELNEEFPLEQTAEELSAETISARILRYIQHKTSSLPRPGRASLQMSVQEIDPHVVLIRCMQQLHDEARLNPQLTANAFLKAKSSLWDDRSTEKRLDFEITQYAPLMFRTLREVAFGLSRDAYSSSLCALSKMKSEGKSRCRFYVTESRQFILKTLKKEEWIYLREVLADYFQYMTANRNSFLTKICGVYKVASPTGRSFRVLAMHSVLNSTAPMLWKYDLKGSTEGRRVPKRKPDGGGGGASPDTLRDVDWGLIEADARIPLPEARRQAILDQLGRDTAFLSERLLMDYSLFVTARSADSPKDTVFPTLSEFLNTDGGLAAANGRVYYLGVIDFLQKWNLRKQMEHSVKSMLYSKEISAVEPKRYRERFMAFMTSSVLSAAK